MDENEKLKQKVAALETANKKLRKQIANLHQFSNSEFNNKLINSLPGIFYLYQKKGDDYLLKKWNKNHEINLEYSAEELLDMKAQHFFTMQEFKHVAKGIDKMLKVGTAQITALIKTKQNKLIPYYFEGFKFEDGQNVFFMGVGLDISEQESLKVDLNKAESEKKRSIENLNRKKRELVTTALKISQSSKLIKYAQNKIDELIIKYSDKEISTDLKNIEKVLNHEIATQDNWQVFTNLFQKVHPNFFEKLKKEYPDLSKTELRFCAYLRIHLSSSQILSVLNVSYEAIKKTRYRIRKKMKLNSDDSLEDYIAKF